MRGYPGRRSVLAYGHLANLSGAIVVRLVRGFQSGAERRGDDGGRLMVDGEKRAGSRNDRNPVGVAGIILRISQGGSVLRREASRPWANRCNSVGVGQQAALRAGGKNCFGCVFPGRCPGLQVFRPDGALSQALRADFRFENWRFQTRVSDKQFDNERLRAKVWACRGGRDERVRAREDTERGGFEMIFDNLKAGPSSVVGCPLNAKKRRESFRTGIDIAPYLQPRIPYRWIQVSTWVRFWGVGTRRINP